MLKLVHCLVEMKFFKKSDFIFAVVVGHTKNAADRIFNAVEKECYHKITV